MKLPLKIALISFAIVALFSMLILIAADPRSGGTDYLFALGIGCILGGGISIVLAIVFLVAKSKQWGMGFLLAAGLLFLVGFASCGGAIYSGGLSH